MNWYLQVLRKYAVFTGRARRAQCASGLTEPVNTTLVANAPRWSGLGNCMELRANAKR